MKYTNNLIEQYERRIKRLKDENKKIQVGMSEMFSKDIDLFLILEEKYDENFAQIVKLENAVLFQEYAEIMGG